MLARASNYLASERAALDAIHESVLEHPEANRIVNTTAQKWIDHWETRFGPITDPVVRNELLCCYKAQAWNDLFKAISM